jgi:N,N-dimethylformamidase
MSFTAVTADTNGVIYGVRESGSLQFYRDDARDGTTSWAHGGVGRNIGSAWQRFERIVSGGNGVIYAIADGGDLYFYRHLSQDATAVWANGGRGQVIGSGWDEFRFVFSGGDGVLYAVTQDGDLRFYRDEARDGTRRWAHGGVGQVIGEGWHDHVHVCAAGGGVIYAVTANGDLLYFRDLARNGRRSWAFGGVGQPIGVGWHNYTKLMPAGDGILYAIAQDGFLMYHRDLAQDGTMSWAHSGVPQQIGKGWTVVPRAIDALEGYPVPVSVMPGRTVAFKTSASDQHTLTIHRLSKQPDGFVGVPVASEVDLPAGLQRRPVHSWLKGCGWRTTHEMKIPRDWTSGFYSARLTDRAGHLFNIVFIVKSRLFHRRDIALLANTNTWNAYNPRGGRSRYTTPKASELHFERPNPETSPEGIAPTHLTRSELLVHKWLEDSGYEVDVYADVDFHRGISGLHRYKALILSTHPEYWTIEMRDHLDRFLEAGGNLVYLAGNGLFEKVGLGQLGRSLVFTNGNPDEDRAKSFFRNLTPPRPERPVLGVAYRGDAYTLFGPMEVMMASHRFFAGTGLADGDRIGELGVNGGGASGWEMDTSLPGLAGPDGLVSAEFDDDRGEPPPNLELLARGVHDGKVGADMTCYETTAGGIVFSAGSISFGGSLVVDAALQRVVRNVLDECLAR